MIEYETALKDRSGSLMVSMCADDSLKVQYTEQLNDIFGIELKDNEKVVAYYGKPTHFEIIDKDGYITQA